MKRVTPELMKFLLQHPVLIVSLDLIFCILRNPWKLIFNPSFSVIPSVVDAICCSHITRSWGYLVLIAWPLACILARVLMAGWAVWVSSCIAGQDLITEHDVIQGSDIPRIQAKYVHLISCIHSTHKHCTHCTSCSVAVFFSATETNFKSLIDI